MLSVRKEAEGPICLRTRPATTYYDDVERRRSFPHDFPVYPSIVFADESADVKSGGARSEAFWAPDQAMVLTWHLQIASRESYLVFVDSPSARCKSKCNLMGTCNISLSTELLCL